MSRIENVQFATASKAKNSEDDSWKYLAIWIGILAIALVVWAGFSVLSNNVSTEAASDPNVNAEGMLIYQQSERSRASLPVANASGLALYHDSERARSTFSAANEVGMAVYHLSERGYLQPTMSGFSEAGLELYHNSERSASSFQPVQASQDGMAAYHASERSRDLTPTRLFEGQPFNAYQRSEWLGEGQ